MKIIDLILKIIEIIELQLNKAKRQEYENKKEHIENDVGDYFDSEFGGMPDHRKQTDLPSSKTDELEKK